MRKASLIWTMLLLAGLLLAACGGEGTATNAPATNAPTDTAQPTSTTDMTTPTAVGTLDLTTTPEVPVTGEESPNRLTNLMDYGVWNQNGEQIGNVDDMVLDLDNSNIAYAVVGSGGFLGLGEKEVLVPWDMLQLQTAADNTTGGENGFLFTGNQDYYNNAPDTDVSSLLPEVGQPAADGWDATIRDFWSTGVVPGTTETAGTEAPAATEAAATDVAVTATPGMGVEEVQGVILASDLLDTTIQTFDSGTGANSGQAQDATASPDTAQATATVVSDGTAVATDATGGVDTSQSLGAMDLTVDDVIVDPNSGQLQYLIVTGAFTAGQRTVPVPVKFLRWDPNGQSFSLGVNPIGLLNAPAFEDGQYPDFTSSDWTSQLDQYWNNLGPEMLVSTPAP